MFVRFTLALAALAALESEAAAGSCVYTPGQAAAFVACMYGELEAVQVQLAATQADLASAEATIGAQQATIASLQGQVAANGATVAAVQGSVAAIQADYLTGSDLAGYATTADLAGYATTADLAGYATTAALGGVQAQVSSIQADYVTSADLGPYVTQAELAAHPTFADLSAYATSAELVGVQNQVAAVQGQVLAIQFDYVTSAELGGYATVGSLNALQSQVADLDLRVSDLESLHAERVAFVTSVQYPVSSLGGVPGADAICQAHAASAGLQGTFLAWLGDGAGGPADRFTLSDSPYVRVDGAALAADWFDLTDGALANPLEIDEFGALSAAGMAWSGVNPDGTASGATCNGWTNPLAVSGGTGNVHSAALDWTSGVVGNCGASRPVYCFQQ
ncbi:MAG: hypothetical protein H6735_14615 [Alphaproteobacteria bacterium]|nr:hypothetical protein [Alphaproteobacteria bacterium]